MVRQAAQRALQLPAAIVRTRVVRHRIRRRERLDERPLRITIDSVELTEELPSRAVPRQMVQAEVGRDGLEPPGASRTRGHFAKSLERPQKHGLSHVFCLRRVPQQAYGCGEHHVLVLAHKGLKYAGVGHSISAAAPAPRRFPSAGHYSTNPRTAKKFQVRLESPSCAEFLSPCLCPPLLRQPSAPSSAVRCRAPTSATSPSS